MRPIESPRSAIERQPLVCASQVSRDAWRMELASAAVRRVARAWHDHRGAVRVGREQLVGARRVAEAGVGEEPEQLLVHVAADVPRLDLLPANRVKGRPWFGLRSRHEEREPEAVPFLVEPGVDALRIRVQDGPGLWRHRREVALGRLPPAERPDEAVGVELALAEHLGESPGRDVPPDLHLPHPLLGVDEPLGHEQVVHGFGSDVGDARDVADDGHGSLESWDGERAAGLRERPAGDPGKGPDADADHDEDDDERHRQHPLETHAPSCRDPPDRRDPTRSKDASARQFDAQTELGRPAHDRIPEDDVGETDAEMRHDDAAGGRPLHAAQDRLAEGGVRIRVVIEQPRIAVGEELLALVDEEQRRAGGHGCRAVGGVVDRHDERIGCEPVRCHHLAEGPERSGGHDHVGTVDRGLCRGSGGRRGDPLRQACFLRERCRAIRVTIEYGELHAGQHVPDHRDVAVPLDPAADERRANRPAGDQRVRNA